MTQSDVHTPRLTCSRSWAGLTGEEGGVAGVGTYQVLLVCLRNRGRRLHTPGNAVELDLVVGDQHGRRVDSEQVGALDFLDALADTIRKPVPGNVGAVVESQEGG